MCSITLWLICFLLASAGSNQSIQHSLFNSLNKAAGQKYFRENLLGKLGINWKDTAPSSALNWSLSWSLIPDIRLIEAHLYNVVYLDFYQVEI